MFDEAIQNFESVLDTRIPERKIDFSLDYEVINELAGALYCGPWSHVEAGLAPSGATT